MEVFEIIIGLLIAGAALTVVARRIGAPYPALVALAGAGLALLPNTPTLSLDPELALTLFVAPVLLDAAFDASPRDLRKNWKPVASLALGAVVLTVVVVAVVARLLVPSLPWGAAVALGAVVAPPDAAAASTVLKQLRPPHRLLVILEGESLFNDASALLIYRLAVGFTVAGTLSPSAIVPTLIIVTVGSVILGLVLSRVVVALTTRIEDPAIAIVFQFCGTFAVWILAERLHLSGILTMVVFAMSSARRSAARTPARVRIPAYAVWDLAVFVLNVLAFILVGFQLKAIVARIDTHTLLEYTGVGALVCGALVVARFAWVTAAVALERARGDGVARAATPWRVAVIASWCGMRGIITLAAALALPTGRHDDHATVAAAVAATAGSDAAAAATAVHAFPHRDLILFVAFCVVIGTLVIQGLTLRPLMKLLPIADDNTVDREAARARVEALRAGLDATADVGGDIATLLRSRYDLLLRRAEAAAGAFERQGDDDARAGGPQEARPEEARAPPADVVDDEGAGEEEDVDPTGAAAVRAATAAERQRLLELRAAGAIGDAAFQRVEQELDLEELDLQRLVARDEG